MIPKPASQLRLNDETDLFCDRKLQRVRIATVPKHLGGSIEFAIVPVGRLSYPQRLIRLKADEIIAVHPNKTLTLDQKYERLILSALVQNQPAITSFAIWQRLSSDDQCAVFGFKQLALQRVKKNCLQLAQKRKLVRRTQATLAFYRLPLSSQVGLPVVEHPAARYQRFGWIKTVQLHQPTGVYHPVCEWENGQVSFSREEHLEPVVTPFDLQRLETLRLLKAGAKVDRVEIPLQLIHELRDTKHRECSLHIAKLIGAADWDALILKRNQRNAVLDYLDVYYPGWRSGISFSQSA